MKFRVFISKIALLALLILSLAGCQSAAQQQKRATNSAPTPSPTAARQSQTKTEDETIDRPTSEPYTGSLSVFEDPKREENLQIWRVMDILGIKEGSAVADMGAGSGWFTVRAARRVGTAGVVYAVEINQEYIKHIEERATKEGYANIRTVLGREDDPLLPENGLDAVLLLKTYHEIAQPIRFLKRVGRSMRASARLGIIDRNGKGDDHGIDREKVIEEARRAGFVLVEEHNFVKDGMDYFLVFRVNRS